MFITKAKKMADVKLFTETDSHTYSHTLKPDKTWK